MAGEINSLYMNLPVPQPGITAGPQYAIDLDSCMTIIDAHTHTAGSGQLITTAALDINADLSMSGNALNTIKALTLSPQASAPAINSIYESGVDLYYRDGNGNQIRITQSGSVAGASGTITGLPSGTASASYAAGTFTFQSATNTAANIDGASYVLRLSSASSPALTLSPPSALSGGSYQLFLPTIPSTAKSVMMLNTSGVMTANVQVVAGYIDAGGGGTIGGTGGYSVSKLGTGIFQITYSAAFVSPPAVTLTTVSGYTAGTEHSPTPPSNTGFIALITLTSSGGGTLSDQEFSFSAIGI